MKSAWALRNPTVWLCLVIALWSAPSRAQDSSLSAAEVGQVISAAVAEATARGTAATVAVVDRVGNVLGVFRMTGSGTRATVSTGRGIAVGNGLENIQDFFAANGATDAPGSEYAAIAKAITGAYLSTGGNAFTTRTANQIIQEHFNPGESFAPSGPLFGVQFSQLPCSDLSVRHATDAAIPGLVNTTIGPKRSPLGLSADPGGLPLYKGTDLVGGIGVEADGTYSIDSVISDIDSDAEEIIALAGQSEFAPPADIKANRIFVEGKSLRYTDAGSGSLSTTPSAAPAFATINGTLGSLLSVTGYNAGAAITAGQSYGTTASGISADPGTTFNFVGGNVFVLLDATGANRYPPRDSSTPTTANNGLTAAEVTTILGNALKNALAGRSQIRRPLNSHIQVSVSVVDLNGVVLGIARTSDGPIFGIDVSLQKARTAALLSDTGAAAEIRAYDSSGSAIGGVLGIAAGQNLNGQALADFVTNAISFLGADALSDGTAFADRSGGNLSRPFYPDGIDGSEAGPFSKAFAVWSPFNTGLQLDSVIDNIGQHLLYTEGITADTDAQCTFYPFSIAGVQRRLGNGMQIFPGSVPIYRDSVLVGGIGVSGDGVEQDDMVAFLGLHDAGVALATGIGNAPQALRADNLSPRTVRLRYVQCPFKPLIASQARNVCRGK